MPDYTSKNIRYPLPSDRVKDGNVVAKLADDIKAVAQTADTAITEEGERAFSAASEALALANNALEAAGEGFRQVLHPLGNHGSEGYTDTLSERHVRVPLRLPATINDWDLVLKNVNDLTRTNHGELVFEHAAFIGERAKDSSGNYTQNMVEGTIKYLGLPEAEFTAGTVQRRYIFKNQTVEIEANKEYLICYGYKFAAGTTRAHKGPGGSYLGTVSSAVSWPEVTNEWSSDTVLNTYLRMRAPVETPYYFYGGSSSEAGYLTNYPLRDSWAWQHAMASGAIPAIYGLVGSTLAQWNTGTVVWGQMTGSARADKAFVGPASNTIYGGATLAQTKADFATFVDRIRKEVSDTIEYFDVFPRSSELDEHRSVRIAFNQYLHTLPHGATRCISRATAVSDKPGYMRTDLRVDNGHVNALGHQLMAASALTDRARAEQVGTYRFDNTAGKTCWAWDPTAGREQLIYGETGLRDITALAPNVTSGKLYLSRSGNEVSLIFSDVAMSGATGTSYDMIAAGGIPLGFRPPLTHWYNGVDGPPGLRRVGVASSGWVPVYLSPIPSDFYRGKISWSTQHPWPTSLPGTAVGTIPN